MGMIIMAVAMLGMFGMGMIVGYLLGKPVNPPLHKPDMSAMTVEQFDDKYGDKHD